MKLNVDVFNSGNTPQIPCCHDFYTIILLLIYLSLTLALNEYKELNCRLKITEILEENYLQRGFWSLFNVKNGIWHQLIPVGMYLFYCNCDTVRECFSLAISVGKNLTLLTY